MVKKLQLCQERITCVSLDVSNKGRAPCKKKIDKLKNQLSALADLVKPLDEDDEELGEEEMDVLREAGILPPVSKSKRRRQNYTRAKHIVFAENEDEGVYPPFVC